MIFSISLFAGCRKVNNELQNEASNGQQIFLRLADNQNEDYVTVRADIEFARIVEEKSKGRIKIDIYAGGQLGDEKKCN